MQTDTTDTMPESVATLTESSRPQGRGGSEAGPISAKTPAVMASTAGPAAPAEATPGVVAPVKGTPTARPVFFLHIPKTAGTSLLALFGRSYPDRDIYRLQGESEGLWEPRKREALWRKLEKYRFVAGHVRLGFMGTARERFDIVTVLRHPVDRVLSLHGFYRNSPTEKASQAEKVKIEVAKRLSAAAFAESGHPLVHDDVNDGMCRMLIDAQPRYVAGMDAAERFQHARHNLETMSFGLCEAMEASLELFRQRLPFFPTANVPRLNPTQDRQRLADVKLGDFERIVRANLADLLLFDWAQAEFRRRLERLHDDAVVASHLQRPLPGFVPDNGNPSRWTWRVDDVVCGENWHGLESLDGQHPYRFTGPGNRATLWFGLPPVLNKRVLKVSLRILLTVEDCVLNDLRLELNNRPVPHVHRYVPDQGVFLTSTLLPAACDKRGFLKVTLITPYTVVPAAEKTDSRDQRSLGVALHSIAIEPAEHGEPPQ